MRLVDGDPRPVAESLGALELLAEGVAEGGVAIDRRLPLRLVDEDAVPARKGAEGEGIAHLISRVSGSREVCRPRAPAQQRRRLAHGVAHGLGNVVAVEEREEGTGWPLSVSRKSSSSYWSSSRTAICRVRAISIAPLFFSLSTLA